MGAKKDNSLSLIGKRIRTLRIERALTQSELAGKDVTRNMLSRIENGAALPSLPTLVAIAARLDVPVGALLGDFESYAAHKVQEQMRSLMKAQKYAEAIACCDESGQAEDSAAVRSLLSKCALCLAEKYYREGELTRAKELLLRAEQAGGDAGRIYVLGELIHACRAVDSEPDTGDEAQMLRRLIFDKNDVAIYLYALKKLGDIAERPYSQPSEEAEPLLAELSPIIDALSDGFYKAHIEAKFEMLRAEYLRAKTKLLALLTPEPLPALLWAVYADLEFCCRCCGDFENAYKYSGLRLELIKKIN